MLFEATVWGERVSFPSCHKMKSHEKSLAPFLRTLIWSQLAIKKQQKANRTLPMGTTAAGSWCCSAGIGNPQWLPGSGKEIGKLLKYQIIDCFYIFHWIISIIFHQDHRCRSGLRLRAASFVDDIARWGTVTPLALDSQDHDHNHDHDHNDVFCEYLLAKRKHTWPPTWFPFLSVRVEHQGILSSASTRIHLG